MLKGSDFVLGLYRPNPSCVSGRSVQKSLSTRGHEGFGARSSRLRSHAVQHPPADVRNSEVLVLGSEGDAQ